jgi:hypothetical protein
MTVRATRLAWAVAIAAAIGGSAAAPLAQGTAAPVSLPASVPFAVGESLSYSLKFGVLRVGSANMSVRGLTSVRGTDVVHTIFAITGGTLFFRVNDVMQSWVEPRMFASLRFWQDVNEGSYHAKRRYELFGDRQKFSLGDQPEQESVPTPLDDGSFIYFIRTQPLEVGTTYTFDRYFDPAANPVKIRVLRKERIAVPAGTFDAIVVQPIIKTSGIFAEGGRAEIWFSDDTRRLMLQMKTKLNFGSLNLYLLNYRLATGGEMQGER